jgi:aspartate aminotransferase-like enzyme
MGKPMIDHRGPQFASLLENLTARMRPIFGTAGDIVFLGSSGTGGLEAAVASTFGAGDTLLACPVGVFGRRLIAIARTYGCKVEVLETELGHALDPAALEERLRADAGKAISGILLTHNETSTGVQNDMAALARVTRAHGAITIVDSVSGLGATRFEMDEWGFDVVVAASQKVFAAPPGVSMIAASERGWKRMETAKTPRFYFDLLKAREFARQGQTPWTPPVSAFFALDAALERYAQEGAEAVWRRHDCYARAIRGAFTALGMEIFSQPDAHSVTVVAGNVPAGVEAATLLRKLREERGVVLSGGQLELKGKIVRMGTMGDVSQTDVLGALGALEIALLEHDIPVRIGSGVQAALRVFLDLQPGVSVLTRHGGGKNMGE